MDWARILAYVNAMVDQKLLARNEYLAAENRILKAELEGRLKLSDAERATLGEGRAGPDRRGPREPTFRNRRPTRSSAARRWAR